MPIIRGLVSYPVDWFVDGKRICLYLFLHEFLSLLVVVYGGETLICHLILEPFSQIG